MSLRRASKQNTNAAFSLSNPGIGGIVAPVINYVIYTDSNYVPIDDTAISMTGGYVKIIGSGFSPSFVLFLNGLQVTSGNTSYVSSSEIRALLPSSATLSTYSLMLFNANNVGFQSPNVITYSPFPVYGLPVAISVLNNIPFTQQLGATGDAPLTYTIISGTLPTGVTLSSTGLLSGTPTGYTSNQTFNFTIQVDDAQKQSITQQISLSVQTGDTYWTNTVLLLNTSTEYTFIRDASLNNSQLTIQGDARPSNFNPYLAEGYYGTYHSGSDWIVGPSTTIGTNPFTIEMWVYPTSIPSAGQLFTITTNGGLQIQTTTANINIGTYGVSNTIATSGGFVVNQWLHIVIVRASTSANQTSVFINGIRAVNGTVATNYVAGAIQIGGISGQSFIGYMSNVKFTNGYALYDPTLTTLAVPTAPVTTSNTTTVLACQSNRIKDNSFNNYAFTVGGTPTVTSIHPFATPTTASYNTLYSTSFDGVDDYATVSSTTAFNLVGDFTLECWVYPTELVSNAWSIFDARVSGQSAAAWVWGLGVSGNSYVNNIFDGTAYTGSALIPLRQWTHVAWVRTGGSLRSFVNGVQDYNNDSFGTSPRSPGTTTAWIGTKDNGLAGYETNGAISNLRIVVGTCLYTSTFPPSTTPLTAVPNTVLLTCQDNQLKDNGPNNFTITGVNQIRPVAVSPFTMTTGTTTVTSLGSAYFDGTGDYLTLPATPSLILGAGDYTVESWVYLMGTQTTSYGWGVIGTYPGSGTGWSITINRNIAGQGIVWILGGSIVASYTTSYIPLNTWTHLAVTRRGSGSNNTKIFLNGFIVAQATDNTNDTYSGVTYIGGQGSGQLITGNISDSRVIKGTALYTSTFLPPQTPLTPVANTQLLTCQYNGAATNNGFVDQSSFNNIITRNGNVTQGTFSPYSQTGWSNYFGGNDSYLASSGSSILPNTQSTFTIECWIYMTANASAYSSPLVPGTFGDISGVTNYLSFGPVFSSGAGGNIVTLYWYDGSSKACSGTGLLILHKWTHIAVSVVNNNINLYIDGELQSRTGTTTLTNRSGTSGSYQIGAYSYGNSSVTNGYISNLRVVSGTGLYTSGFTPSTTPLSAIANTTLLTCQSPSIVDNGPLQTTWTRNGTSSVQSLSPFGGVTSVPASYSVKFDNTTGSYFTFTGKSSLALGTGDFTIESWVYRTMVVAQADGWYTGTRSPSAAGGLGIKIQNNGVVAWNTSASYAQGTTAIPLRTWTHLAVTRTSGVLKWYINGVLDYTGSLANDFSNPTVAIGITDDPYYSSLIISNFRLVTGTVVYTDNFTPPTGPLTAIANTALLTCQDNVLKDNSSTPATVTQYGTAQRQITYNPFGTTTTLGVSYSPSVTGGSMYFDGTGDYLVLPLGPQYAIGTSDFTIEVWIYPTTNNLVWTSIMAGANFGNTSDWGLYLGNGTTALTPMFQFNNGGDKVTSSTTVVINQWTHIAVSRVSGTARMFLNGVQTGTAAASTWSLLNSLQKGIGGTYTGSSSTLFTGYISDLRLLDRGIYASNFATPAAPLTPTTTLGANTISSSLMVTGTSGGIIDYHSTNNLETVGNVQLASEDPYAGNYYSNYFDGSGDYLTLPSNQSVFTMGTGDFTVEMWVYTTSLAAGQTFYDTMNGGDSSGTGRFAMQLSTGGVIQIFTGAGSIFTSGGTLLINTWYHVAYVRISNSGKLYVNGTQVNTNYTDNNNYVVGTTSRPIIGINAYDASTNPMFGYISNLRIVKGSGVYTANFTPSTEPLTAMSGTSLLACQSNSFKDNSTNNFTITRGGDTKVKSMNPFRTNTGKSLYFDGTGDSLKLIDNPNINFGAGDFTIEFWAYFNVVNAQMTLISKGWNSSAAYASYLIWMNSDATIRFLASSNGGAWDIANEKVFGTMPAGVWTHVAVTRSGTTFRAFVNGVINNSFTFTSASSLYNSAVQTLFIGDRTDGGTSMNGYIKDIRVTRGVARYTATFTPPTASFLTR